MKIADQEIVQGVLKQDKFWLRKFQKQYQEKLLNFVLQRVDNPQDAEEIAQDALLSAICCFPTFRGQSSLWSWLCAITKHEIADFYRKKKIKTILFSRLPGLERIASAALSPELVWEEKEMKRRIIRCFLNLTEGYREVLRLKYIEGLSLRQIAFHFQKSIKAVEMRLRRARFAFIRNWHDKKLSQQVDLTGHQRELSYLAEYLGLDCSSLQDTKSHSD